MGCSQLWPSAFRVRFWGGNARMLLRLTSTCMGTRCFRPQLPPIQGCWAGTPQPHEVPPGGPCWPRDGAGNCSLEQKSQPCPSTAALAAREKNILEVEKVVKQDSFYWKKFRDTRGEEKMQGACSKRWCPGSGKGEEAFGNEGAGRRFPSRPGVFCWAPGKALPSPWPFHTRTFAGSGGVCLRSCLQD